MAAKGYMNDFGALRNQFDLYVTRNKSTAWYLYRGFREIFNERNGTIYRQENTDMEAEESFELLQQLIMDNSAGGGDFSIYFPGSKAANHTQGSILFRVERNTLPAPGAGLGGFHDVRMSGYLTREDLERERELWELKRENEDLKAAINGPQNFWQQMAQSALENGTIQQLAQQALGLLNAAVSGFMANRGVQPIRPAISVQGLDGQPVPPTTPPTRSENAGEDEEMDYPDAMYQFADDVHQMIGDDPNVQNVFWNNLRVFAQQQPMYVYQLANIQPPQA